MSNIHENSVMSYEEGKANGTFNSRSEAIYWVMGRHGVPMTDREIMQALELFERNHVSPRISEMLAHGVLGEVDSVRCDQPPYPMVRRCVIIAPFVRHKIAGSAPKGKKKQAVVQGMLPTKPGYYWYGESHGAALSIVDVSEFLGELVANTSPRQRVASMKGFWSGQQPEPSYQMKL